MRVYFNGLAFARKVNDIVNEHTRTKKVVSYKENIVNAMLADAYNRRPLTWGSQIFLRSGCFDCAVNEERVDVLHKPHRLAATELPDVSKVCFETLAGGFVSPAIFS